MSYNSKYTGQVIEELLDYVKESLPTEIADINNQLDQLEIKADIITKTVTSEADGKITIEDVEGYTFLNAVAFNNNLPLVVIRFGNYFYVGYYGGSEEPNADTAVTLMFTGKANIEVTVYYIENTSNIQQKQIAVMSTKNNEVLYTVI